MYEKILRYGLGIMGPLDEYKQSRINRIGFMGLAISMLYFIASLFVWMILSFFFSIEMMFQICMLSNYVMFIAVALYMRFYFKRYDVTKVEVYDERESNQWRKFAKKNAIVESTAGFVFIIIFDLINMLLGTGSIPFKPILAFIGIDFVLMLIAGLMEYYQLKKRIIKKY